MKRVIFALIFFVGSMVIVDTADAGNFFRRARANIRQAQQLRSQRLQLRRQQIRAEQKQLRQRRSRLIFLDR